MEEPITIILNKAKFKISKNNINMGLIEVLLLLDSQLSSEEALRENMSQALKMFEEYKPSLKKKIKIINKIKSREGLIKFYFDTILSFSNMSTLHGFSCICKAEQGRSNYNPEKYRMTKSNEERDL